MDAIILTETFLNHVFTGQMDQALAMVSDKAQLIGARPNPSPDNPIFGRHIGPDGAMAMFSAFGELLEPGTFTIESKFGNTEQAAFYGQLEHTARATGKPFQSDWALITKFEDGKLTYYHFYEDTAALADALN